MRGLPEAPPRLRHRSPAPPFGKPEHLVHVKMATAAMVGTGSNTHGMEEKKFEYFSSINSMARKIMQEREKIKQKHGEDWEKMTPSEQELAIDNGMIDPQIQARYAIHRVEREEVGCYPKLLIQTGQKIVHFGEEDITWQDEHSSPFSWETKSQMDFSLTSTLAIEQGSTSSQGESKTNKVPQANQVTKVAQISKMSNSEAPGLGRKEEESSFWKISSERSRLEGEQADFHSLTPSQIKSMEKGEKPLPSYLRQEPPPRELEEVPRAAKPRAPRPPAPPPPAPVTLPPAAISITPAPINVSSTVAGWERAQSTLPSFSNLDDVFTPGIATKSPSPKEPEKADPPVTTSPVTSFSQFNTSSTILKTGFDFLDNW